MLAIFFWSTENCFPEITSPQRTVSLTSNLGHFSTVIHQQPSPFDLTIHLRRPGSQSTDYHHTVSLRHLNPPSSMEQKMSSWASRSLGYQPTHKTKMNWAWWYTPVTPALQSQKQEDVKFEASLGYTARHPISLLTQLQTKSSVVAHFCNRSI